jgi:ribosomal protein S13
LKLHALCSQLNEEILEKSQLAEELQMTDALREEELQCLRARISDMRTTNSKIAIEFE